MNQNQELKPVEERAVGTLEDIGLLDKIIREGKVRAGTSLLDRLSREESPIAKIRQRRQLLEAFWGDAVTMTNQEDWVLSRSREGHVEAMIAAEGARKVVGDMHKDAKKIAATGCWGFEGFGGGDKTNRVVHDNAASACFACHEPQKGRDCVFSRVRD